MASGTPDAPPPSTQDQSATKAGFISQLSDFAGKRSNRLRDTVLGNLWYEPKNKFTFTQKEKIFSYLRMKYFTIVSQAEELSPKKFTAYDPNIASKLEFTSLQHMKDTLLKMKTHIQAAMDTK